MLFKSQPLTSLINSIGLKSRAVLKILTSPFDVIKVIPFFISNGFKNSMSKKFVLFLPDIMTSTSWPISLKIGINIELLVICPFPVPCTPYKIFIVLI